MYDQGATSFLAPLSELEGGATLSRWVGQSKGWLSAPLARCLCSTAAEEACVAERAWQGGAWLEKRACGGQDPGPGTPGGLDQQAPASGSTSPAHAGTGFAQEALAEG